MKLSTSYFTSTMLGEIAFIKHDYNQALSLYVAAYKLQEYALVGKERQAFLLTRLYYLYHIFNDPETKQKVATELNRLGVAHDIPPESYPFEYSSYVPLNIENTFNKAREFSTSNIDSARFYLERCLEINDCPLVNLYLGDVLYQQQDLDALQHYQKAYGAYAWDPAYLSRLFYAYFVNVDKAGAKKTLDRLKIIGPTYHEITRLETLLNALS